MYSMEDAGRFGTQLQPLAVPTFDGNVIHFSCLSLVWSAPASGFMLC